jgi:threonine dehydrogenase-like Zn-dependent dehydrogenase
LTVVDDRISDNEAACLQSLSDSVAPVETAEIRIGDSVAIFGQGSMGMECMQVARLSGAGTIITVDVRDEACAMSKQLGADSGINAMRDDPVAAIRDLTDGNGANVVFECAGGSPEAGTRRCTHSATGCGFRSIGRQNCRCLLVRCAAGV